MKVHCIALTLLVFSALLTTSMVSVAQQTVVPADKQEKFDPKRDSEKDLAEAIKIATKDKKRILLDVGGEWCSWCHKLDKLFKTDAEVAATLKQKFVLVKVNFSPENENKQFLAKYPKIQGYPHLFVLESTGKLLHSQDTGLLETGDHHDHDKVMAFLKKWSN